MDRNYGSDLTYSDGVVVALRKESVDRNGVRIDFLPSMHCRSPQGERG